jgi:hypothetical protein
MDKSGPLLDIPGPLLKEDGPKDAKGTKDENADEESSNYYPSYESSSVPSGLKSGTLIWPLILILFIVIGAIVSWEKRPANIQPPPPVRQVDAAQECTKAMEDFRVWFASNRDSGIGATATAQTNLNGWVQYCSRNVPGWQLDRNISREAEAQQRRKAQQEAEAQQRRKAQQEAEAQQQKFWQDLEAKRQKSQQDFEASQQKFRQDFNANQQKFWQDFNANQRKGQFGSSQPTLPK